MKIYFADIFYLFGEGPPFIFLLYFRYIYFLLYVLLSRNRQQDRFQYLTYHKIMHYSLFQKYICYYILFTLDSVHSFSQTKFPSLSLLFLLLQTKSIYRKFRRKSICITTQLTTFYCYSATNSKTNLSNKWLFFKQFKRGYQLVVFPGPNLIPSARFIKKSCTTIFTDVQKISLGQPCIKAYLCSTTKMTNSER